MEQSPKTDKYIGSGCPFDEEIKYKPSTSAPKPLWKVILELSEANRLLSNQLRMHENSTEIGQERFIT